MCCALQCEICLNTQVIRVHEKERRSKIFVIILCNSERETY